MSALASKLRPHPLDAWRSASARTREQWLLAAVLVTPAIIMLSIFVFYPALQTIGLSFYKWDGISPDMGGFVGFKTFARATGQLSFLAGDQEQSLVGLGWALRTNNYRLGRCRAGGGYQPAAEAAVSLRLFRSLFLFHGGGGRALHPRL